MVKPLLDILQENNRRLAELNAPYDPVSGIGSPIPREKVHIDSETDWYLPVEMSKEPLIVAIKKYGGLEEVANLLECSLEELQDDFINLRFKHDFEFWAYTTVKIQDKRTKQEIKFKLNKPQRKLLNKLEEMRRAGVPIRIVLLKARQWGGSTLVQIYMGWMQIIHHTNWHSTVVAETENQSRKVKAMYSRLLRCYPKQYATLTLCNFEGSSKVKFIRERGCTIGIGSAQKPDGLRGDDQAMLHLTEVGLWKATEGKSPEDLAQTIGALVPDMPDTIIVKESTAKGVGNYFHREFLAAHNGTSGYVSVFVSWFEIEMYSRQIDDYEAFVKSLNEYEEFLWDSGATLEGIAWYRYHKAKESYDDWRMQSEYPTNHIEAFQSTGHRAFAPGYVLRARKANCPPLFKGELRADGIDGKDALKNIEFQPESHGNLWIWALPDKTKKVTNRYCVSVDIGGRSDNADYSVIRVFDRFPLSEGGVPEAIATWRGHLDQDLVCWKAAQIAKFYNNALLIPESNSLAEDTENSEGDQLMLILDQIVKYYDNIYCRTNPEQVRKGLPKVYGFMTNKKTKPSIISLLNKALRDFGYFEYDSRACDEFDEYEIKPNGKYGNVEGKDRHDDIVMCTAIGYWCCVSHMEMPVLINEEKRVNTGPKVVSEASF